MNKCSHIKLWTNWTGLEHFFCNAGQGSSGRRIAHSISGALFASSDSDTISGSAVDDWSPHTSGSDVPHRRYRGGKADGHLHIGCSARRWDRMDSDARERESMDGPEDTPYALAGRELELGIGGWELERHQCWLAGRGTGVRLAVTLHSVDPAFSRFTLH
jgi:hypothetical protein